ncbi:MAG TPA: hypothetical protein VN455_09755 [Methanotrichaceae archaeon]|nr:hypothetical protein [Methanotrichaceae archaeon]
MLKILLPSGIPTKRASGGAITGYEHMADVRWAMDSTGLIFEDLYGGMTINDANKDAMKVYAPWWEAQGAGRKGKFQTLIIGGNTSWKMPSA